MDNNTSNYPYSKEACEDCDKILETLSQRDFIQAIAYNGKRNVIKILIDLHFIEDFDKPKEDESGNVIYFYKITSLGAAFYKDGGFEKDRKNKFNEV